MKGRVICVVCNLVMVANAVSNNSAKLCIFVHGLGQDWEDHEEGIHHAEAEKDKLIGKEIFRSENYDKNFTIDSYWKGLPKEMQNRGICDRSDYYLTKFDTVGSSMKDFKVYEKEFCTLVNEQDTLVFAHSMGNYIAGDYKCIGNVAAFISIASPWELNNHLLRDLLCFAYPFNPVGWIAHFIDTCFDLMLFNQGVCEDSFEFLFNKYERDRIKKKMENELDAKQCIFFCAKNEEYIDPAESCMNPPVKGAKKFKVTGAHSSIMKEQKLINEIENFLTESEISLGRDLEMQSNIEYDI
jgi:hypothetical protein